MQLLRRLPDVPTSEVSRADIILARKPAAQRTRSRNLLEVVVRRCEPRRTHERHEDRRVVTGASATLAEGRRRVTVAIANISSNGIMVVCDRVYAIGTRLAVRIDRCEAIPMIVRWVRDGRIGLEFLAETNVVAKSGVQDFVIDTIRREIAATTHQPGALVGAEQRQGAARHTLMWFCELAAEDGEPIAARIRNVSTGGAMLSFDEPLELAPGQAAELAMGEGLVRPCRIQWSAEGFAGVRFDTPFPVETLVELPCAEIVGDEPAAGPGRATYASREAMMRIEYTGMADPYAAPELDYTPLTNRELYETLYR